MKWNVLVTALVVGVGVCSQSQGFELLDRMLGTGCGCAPCGAQACCEKPCGVAADPGCGCAVDPGCGCAADPGCGCATGSCGCRSGCRPRLLDALFCGHGCHGGCGSACGCGADAGCGCAVDPGCGCAVGAGCGAGAGCNTCCRPHRRSLLDVLFGCGCGSSCGSSCGCGAACGGGYGCGDPCGCGYGAPSGGAVEIGDMDDDAPMPPAPMADPNARMGRRMKHIQASLVR